MEELTLKKANWNCPTIESRKTIKKLNQEIVASFCDLEEVKKIMDAHTEKVGASRYILPVWQNMESIVIGSEIEAGKKGDAGLAATEFWLPGKYCVDTLSDLKEAEIDMVDHPLLRTVLELIPHYQDRPLILEIEAPFSILSALMNPMDIFLCFMEEGELLLQILYKIADAQAEYVKAAIEAGAGVISLADPVGTMNMVGEEYYKEYVGKSELYLMQRLDPYLDRAVIHICKKMSQSLAIAGYVTQESCEINPAADYYEILRHMASDPEIHYTGMTCIHNAHPNLRQSVKLQIKEGMSC